MTSQPDLPLDANPNTEPSSRNVEWFVEFLAGRDWITAEDVLKAAALPVNENNKRKIRRLADRSGGRVAGHQRGYKLTVSMTKEEHDWWRNEWLKSARAIQRRVIEVDIIFFARQPVPQ